MREQLGPQDVEIQATETCHSGFLKVDKLTLKHRLFAGGWSDSLIREVLVKDQAVGVLLYDPALDKVVLVRQFRVGVLGEPISPWLLELVAGMVEPGEKVEQVAARETEEEANCTPEQLVRICEYYNSPGTSTEKLTLFCGRVDSAELGGIHGLDEEHEDIEVVVLELADVIEAMDSGAINNAMTIIAIQWLQLHKSRLISSWNSAS